MARIPAQYQQRGPDPLQRTRIAVGNDPMGQAIERLGAAAMGVADNAMSIRAREQQQAQQEAEMLARAQAQNALLDDEIEQRSKVEELQQRMNDGSLPYTDAEEEFQTWYSERDVPRIANLDAVGAENYDRGLKRNRFTATATLGNLVKGAKRAEFKGQVVAMRDKLGKFASDPSADIDKIVTQGASMKPAALAAGMGETFDKDQQAFSDKVYSDNARARLVAYRDDPAALQQLVDDLTKDGGRYAGKLDADKTNSILAQVQTRLDQLDNKARISADKGEAAAERVLTKLEAQISSTIPAPVETMSEWSQTIALGTPEQQTRWNELLQYEVEVRQMLAMPPSQQRAAVQAMEAEQATNGATLTQQANLRRLKAVQERNETDLREQPLVVNERLTGEPIPDLDLQAALDGNPATVKGQIAARLSTLAAMRKQFGPEVGESPLKPQEAAMLSTVLDKATPTQAASLFGTLRTLFDDAGAYRAAMQQIAPDSPVRALAGMVYAEQRETTVQSAGLFRGAKKTSSGDVARMLLEGEALLNPTKSSKAADGKGGTFPMPTPAAMREVLSDFVGSAYAKRPEAFEVAQQAVRAYYAAAASRSGNVTGELDNRLLQESAIAVIGEPVEVNDSVVLPPWGMDEDAFVDALESRWTEIATRIPEGFSRDFEDYSLRQIDGSRYYVIGANGGFLYDKAGNPVQIDARAR